MGIHWLYYFNVISVRHYRGVCAVFPFILSKNDVRQIGLKGERVPFIRAHFYPGGGVYAVALSRWIGPETISTEMQMCPIPLTPNIAFSFLRQAEDIGLPLIITLYHIVYSLKLRSILYCSSASPQFISAGR